MPKQCKNYDDHEWDDDGNDGRFCLVCGLVEFDDDEGNMAMIEIENMASMYD
jgi:hypothetical protein